MIMEKNQSSEVIIGSGDTRSEGPHPPVSRVAPWLVLPYEKGMKKQAFYNPCELLETNKTCRKFIPELNGKVFWQKPSNGGWLVIVCNNKKYVYSNKNSLPSNSKFGDCFLWNPVTLQIIRLPSLLHWITSKYEILDCTLSSPPSDDNLGNASNNNNSNSTIFFVFESSHRSYKHVIVYCTPGDQQWRKKKMYGDDSIIDPPGLQSIIAVKGKVYALYLNVWHLEIEKQHDQTLTIRKFHVTSDSVLPDVEHGYISTNYTHYIESQEEVFKVKLKFNGTLKVVACLQITRLDFSSMAWATVKSLGDHVLFIGINTTASCSAEKMGLKRGCVFYVLPEDKSLYVHDVEDKCTKLILPFLKLTSTPWFSLEWLMIPTADGIKNKTAEEGHEDDKLKKLNNRELVAFEQNNPCSEYHTSYEHSALFDVIANSLHPVDHVHFRSICKAAQLKIPATSWRSSPVRTKKATYLSPWLVFLTDNGTVFNFVNPMHDNEKYLMKSSALLTGAIIRFSKGGWLLMSKGKKIIFFYNPFTREIIRLPDLPGEETYNFHGISFSSLPTYQDCIVFGVSDWFNNGVRILTINRGNKNWTILEIPAHADEPIFEPCLNNPIFCGQFFLCLGCSGTLGYLMLDGLKWRVLPKPVRQIRDSYKGFLVHCGENILSVYLGQPFGKSVDICKLDASKKEWVKVESLGNYMLFVSSTSSFSATAPPNSYMGNKIYFPRLHGEGTVLYYSLDTRTYQATGSECATYDNFYGSYEYWNTSWIEPNWSLSTDQELDWLASDGVQTSGTKCSVFL